MHADCAGRCRGQGPAAAESGLAFGWLLNRAARRSMPHVPLLNQALCQLPSVSAHLPPPPHCCLPQMIQHDFPNSGATLSGLGGVNTGRDAAEFILLGSNTVQARGGGGIGCTSMAETGTTTQLGSCTASACRCQLTRPDSPLSRQAGVHGRHAARLPAGEDAVRRPAGGGWGPLLTCGCFPAASTHLPGQLNELRSNGMSTQLVS